MAQIVMMKQIMEIMKIMEDHQEMEIIEDHQKTEMIVNHHEMVKDRQEKIDPKETKIIEDYHQ